MRLGARSRRSRSGGSQCGRRHQVRDDARTNRIILTSMVYVNSFFSLLQAEAMIELVPAAERGDLATVQVYADKGVDVDLRGEVLSP